MHSGRRGADAHALWGGQATRNDGTGSVSASGALDDEDGGREMAVELRCQDAFLAILHFERTHCLTLQARALLSPHTNLLYLAVILPYIHPHTPGGAEPGSEPNTRSLHLESLVPKERRTVFRSLAGIRP
jgi:hypothetical protein